MITTCSRCALFKKLIEINKINRQQLSMIYVYICGSKCSKLKWNNEPQENGFTVMFSSFDVISMVFKCIDHGKLLSICFHNNILVTITYQQP